MRRHVRKGHRDSCTEKPAIRMTVASRTQAAGHCRRLALRPRSQSDPWWPVSQKRGRCPSREALGTASQIGGNIDPGCRPVFQLSIGVVGSGAVPCCVEGKLSPSVAAI